MWSVQFGKALAERMVRGAAIGVLVVLGKSTDLDLSSAGVAVNVFDLDAQQLAGCALGGALLSLVFSVIGNTVSGNGPAFTRVESIPPETRPRRARL